MNRARVIFCAYDSPGYLAGGPNTWLRRLLPDLRSSGFDVHPLVIHTGRANDCPLVGALERAHFPVQTLARSTAPFVEHQVIWLLRRAREIQPAVFVANLVTPAFYAAKWLRRAGIPVVGVLHSDAPFCDAMMRHFVHGRKDLSFEAVVCVSSAIESRASRTNPNGSRIVRIPCGAPVTAIQRDSNREGLRVLYVGRITQDAKRALDVAKSFCSTSSRVPSASFTIVGAGPEEESLRQILAESPRVTFAGAVAPEEIPAILARHDVFVLLSDYEGLPIALLEAMAAGLVPVCLNASSGITEVVSHGRNGVIVADRDESFLQAIVSLDEDRQGLTALSREARLTIEREYASGINHARWATLLGEVGSRSSGRIDIPFFLRLPPPDIAFGSEDLRRPPLARRFLTTGGRALYSIRQRLRPRARIKQWLHSTER